MLGVNISHVFSIHQCLVFILLSSGLLLNFLGSGWGRSVHSDPLCKSIDKSGIWRGGILSIANSNFLACTNVQSQRHSSGPVSSTAHRVSTLLNALTLKCLSALNFHTSSLCSYMGLQSLSWLQTSVLLSMINLEASPHLEYQRSRGVKEFARLFGGFPESIL